MIYIYFVIVRVYEFYDKLVHELLIWIYELFEKIEVKKAYELYKKLWVYEILIIKL